MPGMLLVLCFGHPRMKHRGWVWLRKLEQQLPLQMVCCQVPPARLWDVACSRGTTQVHALHLLPQDFPFAPGASGKQPVRGDGDAPFLLAAPSALSSGFLCWRSASTHRPPA